MKLPEVFFTTSRLLFRPFENQDLDPLSTIVADPEVVRYVGDGQPLDRKTTAKWIRVSRSNVSRHGFGTGAIIERHSSTLIGWGGLARPPNAPPEIIYGFCKTRWGRGYGREFVNNLIAYLRDTVGLMEARATVHPSNIKSAHILIDEGFRLLETHIFEDQAESQLYTLNLQNPARA
ncbi:GNAT family N-acetyltransferase [Microvirga rosea]|uniref:GNAT family N-acetyltransferase n=1 Tax=Microvirga rosea TaxID=2715425 RepID=UPI001D0BBF2F|nr:GNAT family N-acetyltransferase [Microvirga rosea]MCB8822247.1 GNAT family N-acetyltransferase [Microvirga rosea]